MWPIFKVYASDFFFSFWDCQKEIGPQFKIIPHLQSESLPLHIHQSRIIKQTNKHKESVLTNARYSTGSSWSKTKSEGFWDSYHKSFVMLRKTWGQDGRFLVDHIALIPPRKNFNDYIPFLFREIVGTQEELLPWRSVILSGNFYSRIPFSYSLTMCFY